MDAAEEDVLATMHFPAAHRAKLHKGTAARLGVRDRKRYFRARNPAEVEATWLGS